MKKSLSIIWLLLITFALQNCKEEVLLDEEKLTEDMVTEATAFKSVKISAVVYEDSYPSNLFRIYLLGTTGKVKVSWGDGSSSTYALGGTESYTTVEHEYSTSGTHEITMTGDLKRVTEFSSYYGEGSFDKIDVRGLTGLKTIQVGLTYSAAVIDLSHNTNLNRVELVGLNQLQEVVLPAKHKIKEIDLGGSASLSTSALDQIVNSIYRSVSTNRIRNGYFNLASSWYYDEEEVPTMIGPPSAHTKQQLRKLRDSFGWTVTPNP
jgi:hypothetical protein